MKNKRWKRKAKRMFGTCLNSEGCTHCIYEFKCEDDFDTFMNNKTPQSHGIRFLENYFKGRSGNNV